MLIGPNKGKVENNTDLFYAFIFPKFLYIQVFLNYHFLEVFKHLE